MDFRRTRPGEWIAGLAGAALLVSLFVGWYRPAAGGDAVSGWEAFAIVDVVLALLALGAISLPLIAAWQPTPAVPIAADSLTTLFAIVVFVLILIRTLNTPGLGADEDAERLAGAWLGLAATFAILAGAAIGMRSENHGPGSRGWEPGEGSSVAVSGLPAPKAGSGSPPA